MPIESGWIERRRCGATRVGLGRLAGMKVLLAQRKIRLSWARFTGPRPSWARGRSSLGVLPAYAGGPERQLDPFILQIVEIPVDLSPVPAVFGPLLCVPHGAEQIPAGVPVLAQRPSFSVRDQSTRARLHEGAGARRRDDRKLN